jgi:type II secretory pathway component PulF
MSQGATSVRNTQRKKRSNISNDTRLSVSLPTDLVERIEEIAKSINTSMSKVAFMLITEGLKAREDRHARLTTVVHQLQTSTDTAEQKQLAEALSSMLFSRDINAQNSVGEPSGRRAGALDAASKRLKDQRRRSDKAR